eukprot:3935569-Rhodomonas_salina.1
MPGTDVGYPATRCPVLTSDSDMQLEMSGTDIGYAASDVRTDIQATLLCTRYAMSVLKRAMLLWMRYAMSSTDVGYSATRCNPATLHPLLN